jgi:hypothetical protein
MENYTGIGTALGAGIGTALEVALNNPAWIAIGAVIGVSVGLVLNRRRRNSNGLTNKKFRKQCE